MLGGNTKTDRIYVNGDVITMEPDGMEAEAFLVSQGRFGLVGWGYDDTLIEEMRHLHRTDLDEAAPENPVSIHHASGHLSYANTMALKLGNISKNTPQTEGGTIHKDDYGQTTHSAATETLAYHLGIIGPMYIIT